jgi:hypothetical protein
MPHQRYDEAVLYQYSQSDCDTPEKNKKGIKNGGIDLILRKRGNLIFGILPTWIDHEE